MKKRVQAILAVMLLSSAFLAACSGKESGSTGPEPSDNTNDKPYEIVLAYPGVETPDVALVQDEMNKLIEDKIGATVKLLPINWGAWGQQMNLMLSSKEKLDIIFVSGEEYAARVAKGQLVELNDLLARSGKDIVDAIGSDYLNATKINGKIYALPSIRDFAAGSGILMRKDLVDKYKIDVGSIKTFEDLSQVFKIIKENEPGVSPLVPQAGGGSTYTFTDLMNASDFDTLGDSMGVLPDLDNHLKVVNLFENAKYRERLNLVREWYLNGYIPKDAATTKDFAATLISAGKAFAYFDRTKPNVVAQESANAGQQLIGIPFTPPSTQTSIITALMQGIAQNSNNPEKALQFLNLLYSDSKLLNLLDYGIEGKHYVIKGDVIGYPEGTTAETVGYTNTSLLFGNQFISYVFEGNDPDVWEQVEEFNKSAVKSKALGFSFDVEPVKTEAAAVTNVFNQYKGGLENGVLDPNVTLPVFIDKLKAAGLDEIIAEKQKQLDVWAASNP